MTWTQRIVNALRGEAKPTAGRMIVPRREDSLRDYPSAGLTPSKLAAILREADEGSLATAMELFEQMEEKDAHLYSIANTRRLALTGLQWQITEGGGDSAEAADYCREVSCGTGTPR